MDELLNSPAYKACSGICHPPQCWHCGKWVEKTPNVCCSVHGQGRCCDRAIAENDWYNRFKKWCAEKEIKNIHKGSIWLTQSYKKSTDDLYPHFDEDYD